MIFTKSRFTNSEKSSKKFYRIHVQNVPWKRMLSSNKLFQTPIKFSHLWIIHSQRDAIIVWKCAHFCNIFNVCLGCDVNWFEIFFSTANAVIVIDFSCWTRLKCALNSCSVRNSFNTLCFSLKCNLSVSSLWEVSTLVFITIIHQFLYSRSHSLSQNRICRKRLWNSG